MRDALKAWRLIIPNVNERRAQRRLTTPTGNERSAQRRLTTPNANKIKGLKEANLSTRIKPMAFTHANM
jgi:hypothetical protein